VGVVVVVVVVVVVGASVVVVVVVVGASVVVVVVVVVVGASVVVVVVVVVVVGASVDVVVDDDINATVLGLAPAFGFPSWVPMKTRTRTSMRSAKTQPTIPSGSLSDFGRRRIRGAWLQLGQG
jgi:hypothetical protein